MARLRGVTGGRLNVALISAADYFFPRVLAAFAASHPGVAFNLTVHNREGLLREGASLIERLMHFELSRSSPPTRPAQAGSPRPRNRSVRARQSS